MQTTGAEHISPLASAQGLAGTGSRKSWLGMLQAADGRLILTDGPWAKTGPLCLGTRDGPGLLTDALGNPARLVLLPAQTRQATV